MEKLKIGIIGDVNLDVSGFLYFNSDGNNYKSVYLYCDEKNKIQYRVHRLVAKYFLENGNKYFNDEKYKHYFNHVNIFNKTTLTLDSELFNKMLLFYKNIHRTKYVIVYPIVNSWGLLL